MWLGSVSGYRSATHPSQISPHTHPPADGRSVRVEMRLLQQQAPDLGPDITQLAATVDYETQQRVRVKVAPTAGAPRWEVPTDLLPRWARLACCVSRVA